MSKILDLDNIREEADREYGAPLPVKINKDTTVYLRNVMRLKRAARKDIVKNLDIIRNLNEKEDKTEADVDKISAAVFKIIELAAGSDAEALLAAIDDDVTVASMVMNQWLEETQAGEASSSED